MFEIPPFEIFLFIQISLKNDGLEDTHNRDFDLKLNSHGLNYDFNFSSAGFAAFVIFNANDNRFIMISANQQLIAFRAKC